MIAPIRLVRLATDDAAGGVAVLSVEPASDGAFVIRVATGDRFDALLTGTSYGPFAQAALPDRFQEVLQKLVHDGFVQAEGAELIMALSSKRAQIRGRAAVRLGWRKDKRATAALLIAASKAKGDICPIVDALGRIGATEATDLARGLAKKKNLSRRRSGVEALRNLGDAEGLAEAKQASKGRLPGVVLAALGAADESQVSSTAVTALVGAIASEDPRKLGVCADVLYERATPLGRRAVWKLLEPEVLRRPYTWRYAKSVLKRAMLREDLATFALLSYRVERAALTGPSGAFKGTVATVKSGLDGKTKSLRVFGPKTQRYVRASTWRYLRDLARYRPERYVDAAVRVLSHYREADAGNAKGLVGAFGHAFLLHRILHGRSKRFRVVWPRLVHRYASAHAVDRPEGIREEAYPELWDREPAAYLRLLRRARLSMVQEFALEGLLRHPAILEDAKLGELIEVAGRGHALASEMVAKELDRRFGLLEAAGDPGWSLIEALLQDPVEALGPLLVSWLKRSPQAWAGASDRLLVVLQARLPAVRLQAVPVAVDSTLLAAPGFRADLAQAVASRLGLNAAPSPGPDSAETDESSLGALVAFARGALSSELNAAFDTDALIQLAEHGGSSAKQLAGHLLGGREDALVRLGVQGLFALANNDVAAVRRASHAIVRRGRQTLATDPSVLFQLVESDWADTRQVAFDELREVPLASLGLDGVISLCDATDPEVQEVGKELAIRHFEELDGEKVLFRLSEHPATSIRRYALHLIRQRLRPGVVPLMRLDAFFRACLFDLYPYRELKWGVLSLLEARGLSDVRQGEHVAALLNDVLRTPTRSDFDRVSAALARIQIAFPEVSSELVLPSAPTASEKTDGGGTAA